MFGGLSLIYCGLFYWFGGLAAYCVAFVLRCWVGFRLLLFMLVVFVFGLLCCIGYGLL